jgi:F420-0:gamma-glutamyl ligase
LPNFGKKDLYGKPKFGGVDALADILVASANLLFGQTDEAALIVIVRGLKYEKSEKGNKRYSLPKKNCKKSFIESFVRKHQV